MIACLYGRTAEPFVASTVADLQAAAHARGGEIEAVSIESAVGGQRTWESITRLYVLPFDVPLRLPATLPLAPSQLIKALFPRADVVNSPLAHELSWDKLTMSRRLLERGVPMPESLITSDPEEAREFVRRHQQAILKEARSCGGHGHVVVFADAGGAIAGEVPGRRYAVEFEASGVGRSLAHGVLSCPPPFYLQRLVTGVGRGGALTPAQLVRAYVIDGQVVFYTERYRGRVRRPAGRGRAVKVRSGRTTDLLFNPAAEDYGQPLYPPADGQRPGGLQKQPCSASNSLTPQPFRPNLRLTNTDAA